MSWVGMLVPPRGLAERGCPKAGMLRSCGQVLQVEAHGRIS